MMALIYGVLAWAMSGMVANLLVGAGLTLVVYSGVVVGVTALLDSAATGLGGMPGAVIELAKLSGVGEAISILGSALLTRVGLTMAANVAGIRRTA